MKHFCHAGKSGWANGCCTSLLMLKTDYIHVVVLLKLSKIPGDSDVALQQLFQHI
jgi:hypothetical protein